MNIHIYVCIHVRVYNIYINMYVFAYIYMLSKYVRIHMYLFNLNGELGCMYCVWACMQRYTHCMWDIQI